MIGMSDNDFIADNDFMSASDFHHKAEQDTYYYRPTGADRVFEIKQGTTGEVVIKEIGAVASEARPIDVNAVARDRRDWLFEVADEIDAAGGVPRQSVRPLAR